MASEIDARGLAQRPTPKYYRRPLVKRHIGFGRGAVGPTGEECLKICAVDAESQLGDARDMC